LTDVKQYNEQILIRAARNSEENDRISEAIKLYNLAGDYSTVVACLATTLGNTIAQSGPDERARSIERTAAEILRHYERTNRAVGKNRDAVVKLLKIREAIDAKGNGRPEVALEVLESTDLVPLSGDVGKITKRAEEFKDLHESVQRNLQVYLPLVMDTLAGVHMKVKSTMVADATRQMVCFIVKYGRIADEIFGQTLASIRKKSRSLMVFAGILKYRMSPDVYSYLARLDVEIAL
jgi:nuclear pore complex protein Nup93